MPEQGLSFVDVPLGTRPSTDANYTLNGYARTAPSLTKSLNNTLSYYVSGSYMYDNRYALNFSVRGDGSNRFGQDEKEKYLPVWSIGARWNVTDEHWLQGQDLLNYLSLSATFGYQGNVVENVSANLIAKILPLDPETGEFKMTYTKLPNPDLKWEKTKSINLGINFSVLHSKVNGSFSITRKRRLVTQREFLTRTGSIPCVNGGNMKNSGWELSFSLVPVRTRDFVELGFNTSKVYNEVSSNLNRQGIGKRLQAGNITRKGILFPVSGHSVLRVEPKMAGLYSICPGRPRSGELDVTQYMVHVGSWTRI
ncbi:MAG: TonB-dependent receptor domain-containing protein [Butyricimonas faecihominis]